MRLSYYSGVIFLLDTTKVYSTHAATTNDRIALNNQDQRKGNIVKIESSISKTVATPSGESKLVRNKDTNAPESTKAGSAAEVKLTSSIQLQALIGGAGEGQPVDSAKVEAIKQAISDGLFKINPEKIADGLLNSVKELLANNKA